MGFKSAKLLIATVGLCLGSAAIAEDLVYFGTDPTDTVFYYDAETIRRYSNNTVEVWTNWDASKDKTVSWRTMRAKLRLDCDTESFGYKAVYKYSADGIITYSKDFQYPKMESIPPASSINALFKILCPR
jgi:hypothetical protein